ncbi:hypothetical protein NP233_g8573 [Leucocoprinus birnbaumii]|uniref:Uncharacterized protein n=1 Tax=Leucocoprinus birnbaumii TaxID=56174 RepID=A0AAD5VM65_9AGAR|nr:hypothetical protein NP233_g8573 [Leucocoprinus birnbaumii]
MVPPIHEYLPNEIFCDILLQAAHAAGAHIPRQTPSSRQSEPDLRESIKFSSVCQGWRHILTTNRSFWLDNSFKNFLYPSPQDALACMKAVLRRTYPGFNRITMDFRSLKDLDQDQAERIIAAALYILLNVAPEVLSSQWKELCLFVADEELINTISDYLTLEAPKSARAKLSPITSLQVTLALDWHSRRPSSNVSNRPPGLPSLALPYFNTQSFKSLTRLQLTNVRAYVFPSIIHQNPLLSGRMFELSLHRWTCKIDEPLFIDDSDPEAGEADPPMPPFHLVTNSPMNIFNSSFASATTLTIQFPIPVSHHNIPINLPYSPSISNIARLFLKNNFDTVRDLRLTNVTPRIWLALLALLKRLPTHLMTSDPLILPLSTLYWEGLTIQFAPFQSRSSTRSSPRNSSISPGILIDNDEQENIASTSAAVFPPILNSEGDPPLIKRIKEELGLPFDVETELMKVEKIEELQEVMRRCSVLLTSRLPMLRRINICDSKGASRRLDFEGHERSAA